ncbi:MAG: DUF6443 domain-containing protein [Reichenbachiella sp.]|uniref:DUF6443 domain-containing protein n=1 Tax=Reichenbachiella sp. TaxID=2184521 RepID=UPI002967164F|nr:DUF6443 domain-containing protein [Reichenbachiella sp.]MDW3211920.1 DUF6443 domain-containing protein [Reichenbachiella sp.]
MRFMNILDKIIGTSGVERIGLICVGLMLLVVSTLTAEDLPPGLGKISGAPTANQNQTYTYAFIVADGTLESVSWSVIGGTTISVSENYEVKVKWTTGDGTGTISARGVINSDGRLIDADDSKSVTINPVPKNAPPKPKAGTKSCAFSKVLRQGTVPDGETWYWQNSPNSSTTALGSVATYNALNDGYYYLKPRNSAGWGPTSQGVYIDVVEPSIAGHIQGAKDGFDRVQTTLKVVGHRGDQITWLKYGTDEVGTGTTLPIDVTTGTNYLAEVKNDICPAVKTDHVSIQIFKSPEITVSNGANGRKVLSTSSYKSYQWILNGQDIYGATDETFVAQESGSYQVRIVPDFTDQTATSAAVNLSINVVNKMPNSPNYVRTRVINKEGVKNLAQVNASNPDVSTVYIDRLGRNIQTVQKSSSPMGYDVVQHQEYNAYGQATKSYLSHVSTTNTGAYDKSAASRQKSFYSSVSQADRDAKPWSEVKVEKSPAQRIQESGGLGEGYQLTEGYKAEYTNTFNTSADAVFMWEVNGSGDLHLSSTIYYSANSLSKQIVDNPEHTSGNNYRTITFSNYMGQKILTRYFNGNEQFDTYYVYDFRGQLAFVIPPKASEITRESGIDQITGGRIFDTSQTFPASNPTDVDYFFTPGARVTLSPSLKLKKGFSMTQVPEGTRVTDRDEDTDLSKLVFVNKYDEYGRLVSKKVPGVEPVYYVYDKAGRLRLSQDGEQRKEGQWTFTKYDQLGRPVLTGLFTFDKTRAYMQQQIFAVGDAHKYESRGSARHGYTNNLWPTNVAEKDYLVVSYYDDYEFMDSEWTSLAHVPNNGINNEPYRLYPRGLETGGKVRILGSDDWLKSVKYYDDDLQLIQGISDHHRGGLDKVFTQYNWLGEVVKTRFEHEVSESKTVTIDERFVYDDEGRLKEQYHSIDGEPEILIATYQYNELGELIEKNLHKQSDNTFVQSVDYRYNIRGQLTHINNSERTTLSGDTDDHPDRFGMELYYDSSPTGLSFDTQTNGNLAGTTWGHAAMAESDERSYGYSYDQVNRLTGATYREKKGASWNVNTNHNNVSNIKYDLNGNIQALKRKQSNTLIDDLDYDYDGNKLVSLDDIIDHEEGFKDGAELDIEYTYDANGNVISDANKLITSISYNLLNKPETITFTNGDHIDYTYDAAGTRLSMSVSTGGDTYVTDYSSGLIYEDDELITISMPQGRILVEQVGVDYNYDYQYYLTDHLGNTRAMVAPTNRTYQATMESESATTEEAQFLNVDASRHLSESDASSGDESAWLNPKHNRIIGPAKAMKVYKGDQVDATVWAKYTDIVGTSPSGATMLVADAITTAFGVNSGELYNALADAFSGASLLAPGADDVPMAYLNYTFFDKNYENPQSGLIKIGTASRNTYAQLERNITAPDDGFILIWVSNETDRDVDVFFDDFEITHTSVANVFQADDYYPFGLPIAGNKYEDVGNTENRFLYQGKEWQTQLALNLYDFHARQYDPAIGQFTSVDPKADVMPYMGTYAGMMSNPVYYTDPDGECPICVVAIIGAVVNVGIQAAQGNINSWSDFGSYALSGAVGGVGYAVGGPVLGGALMGAGNGLASGGGLEGAVIGGISGGIAGGAFALAGPLAQGLTQNIASPVLGQGLQYAIQGSLAGFAGGTSSGLLTGHSLNESLEMGAKGAALGAGLGFVGGGIKGYVHAARSGFNPWNGQRVDPVTGVERLAAKSAPGIGASRSKAPAELPRVTTNTSSAHSGLQQGLRTGIESDLAGKNITVQSLKMNMGAQGKHIVGHNNFISGKSILTVSPKGLLNKLNTGQFEVLRSSGNKVLVDFGRPIGVYVQPGTTTGVMTNFGWVHIGNNGIHVVPTRPF